MTFTTFQPLITAIQGVVSVESIFGIVAGAAGVAIVFVFAWWAGRKITRMIMSGFRKGKLSI